MAYNIILQSCLFNQYESTGAIQSMVASFVRVLWAQPEECCWQATNVRSTLNKAKSLGTFMFL